MVAVVELSDGPGTGASYARAALGMLPGTRRGTTLPDVEIRHRGVAVDREHLASYDRVCGFRLSDTLPATYPHVLAFPLAMRLMTAADFPLPLIGLVHVANRITMLRAVSAAERLDLAVRAVELRDHARGRQFDVVATASVDGVEVWRGVSTYLRITSSRPTSGPTASAAAAGTARTASPAGAATDYSLSGGGPPGGRPSAGDGSSVGGSSDGDFSINGSSGGGSRADSSGRPGQSAGGGAVWRVPAGVGSDYAAVSGDRNPIHTSRLGARVFGFPRPIAHGMWTKAHALAALEGRLPDAYTVDVTFKAPVLLPVSATFTTASAPGGWEFALASKRAHLLGAVTYPPRP